MTNETANDKFRRLVWAVAEADANMDDNRLNELRENFRTAFVQQGYSTSENSECMQFITVGQTNDGTSLRRPTIGYCLVDTDINISDIMNAAEGCPMPQQVADQCPKLPQSLARRTPSNACRLPRLPAQFFKKITQISADSQRSATPLDLAQKPSY